MCRKLKAAIKLASLVLWIGWCCLLGWLAKSAGRRRWRDKIVCLCYRGILCIAGIRLAVSGEMVALRPLLLVTNHLSYLDMAILGSQQAVRFTPKSEIAAWPLIGGICRLCDAVFVDRRPDKVMDMKDRMLAALAEGAVVSLFPEGTTGNGLHMHAFKSGFFSLAEENIDGRAVIVQPAAIVYTRLRRLPIDTAQWPSVAWYGDMELVPHLWQFLQLGPLEAELIFLPPVTLEQCGDRKKLSAHCRDSIMQAIDEVRSRKPVSKRK
jgi:1-acyl-sn-glycerol-3-phosphate acyltransferase